MVFSHKKFPTSRIFIATVFTVATFFFLPIHKVSAVTIDTASPLPSGTVGVFYSTTLTTSGGSPPYVWSANALDLPTGLVLNSVTGEITGIPLAAGTSTFDVTVIDTSLPLPGNDTKSFSLTIDPEPPSITTTSPLPNGTVGTTYSTTIAATGGTGIYVWSANALDLPTGLVLNSVTGEITGIPLAAGTSTFDVTVTDALLNTDTVNFSLTVDPAALAIASTSPLPNGTVGTTYSTTIAATGGTGIYVWSANALDLPTGLVLNTVTGEITGIPLTAGTSTFDVTVTDALLNTDTVNFSLTVDPAALDITTTSPLSNGIVGSLYSTTISATGGTGIYVWSANALDLPTGLVLNTVTGEITGIPLAAGTSTFDVTVTDALLNTDTVNFSLTVDPAALDITTTSPLSNGIVGSLYSTTISATGGTGIYVWSANALDLPTGLVLNSVTGEITGIPLTSGTSTFDVTVTDALLNTDTVNFSITIYHAGGVSPPPSSGGGGGSSSTSSQNLFNKINTSALENESYKPTPPTVKVITPESFTGAKATNQVIICQGRDTNTTNPGLDPASASITLNGKIVETNVYSSTSPATTLNFVFAPNHDQLFEQNAQIEIMCKINNNNGLKGSTSFTFKTLQDPEHSLETEATTCNPKTLEMGKLITRAQLVSLISNCLPGGPNEIPQGNENNPENPFPDVPKDYWAAETIVYAKKQGWIDGYPDGTFHPNQYINRAEALKIIVLSKFPLELYKIETITATESIDQIFSDVLPQEWYAKYITAGYMKHVIVGYIDEAGISKKLFGPAEPMLSSYAFGILNKMEEN